MLNPNVTKVKRSSILLDNKKSKLLSRLSTIFHLDGGNNPDTDTESPDGNLVEKTKNGNNMDGNLKIKLKNRNVKSEINDSKSGNVDMSLRATSHD